MAITVSAGSTEEIPFTVYVSEKKLKAIHEKQALARQRRIQEKYRLTQWRYRSIVPSQVH
jgi:hypothetical protein